MVAQDTITITIDGVRTEVPKGTTIVGAARKIGGACVPPTMCYYSKLKDSGGRCRSCLVEVTRGSDANPRPMPKLVASCRTEAQNGMEVLSAQSERVRDARAGVTEFLLINHPLDCPVCDQAGECSLQDLSFEYGYASKSRYDFPKRTFPVEDIGEYIQLHMNRCILCHRCVLLADQLTDGRKHGLIDRGEQAKISTYISEAIANDFSGNMIDVCPVGALTDKTFRFKNRVWFLSPQFAHRSCDKCAGKAVIWLRGEDVYRVTARKDEYGEVKDWLCNTCRFHRKTLAEWTVEGAAKIANSSVIAQNHYEKKSKTTEALPEVLGGTKPRVLMNIHDVSEVNKPTE